MFIFIAKHSLSGYEHRKNRDWLEKWANVMVQYCALDKPYITKFNFNKTNLILNSFLIPDLITTPGELRVQS